MHTGKHTPFAQLSPAGQGAGVDDERVTSPPPTWPA
jgi:hypothetical protein